MCNSQDIEDEAHLMLYCEYYKSLRDQLFIKLNSKCHNFAVMTYANKFIYMMSSGTNIFPLVASYLYNAIKRERVVALVTVNNVVMLKITIITLNVYALLTKTDITIVYAYKV